MYYKKWNKAIDTLIKHLSLEKAKWKDERCASMRFIARCYKKLKRYDEAKMWLDKAIKEAPYLRDPYMEKALLEYDLSNWEKVKEYCLMALKIKEHPKTYINEVFSWDETVYDLLSLSCFNLGEYEKAVNYIEKAIEMNPNSKRLIDNLEIMKKYL